MKSFLVTGVVVALAAAWIANRRREQPAKWHKGSQWDRLLRIYDDIASDVFKACQARLVPSTFLVPATSTVEGEATTMVPRYQTHVFECAGDSNTAHSRGTVVLFHAGGANALMYGDWLVPALVQQGFTTVAVDYPCDLGKSVVANSDTANCPLSANEMTDWALDVIQQLQLDKPVSLVGYSYGSFVAAHVASAAAAPFNKLVLIAPAAVFAPVYKLWMVKAILYFVLYNMAPFDAAKNWLREWFYGLMMVHGPAKKWTPRDRELQVASDELMLASHMPIAPVPIAFEKLKEMNQATPTFLLIGDQECILDAGVAVANAQQAQIHVKQYANASHLMMMEHARDAIVDDVVAFLDNKESLPQTG